MNATKGKKLPPEPLTADEIRALINACSKRGSTGVRNRALLAVLYRGGLRISEALGLYPKDLDPQGQSVRVMHGKGDRMRVVGLDAGAWALLQLWLDRRAKLGLRGPVFCTLKGQAIETSYIRAFMKRLARKAGVERRVHAHAFRHSHASELANEGVPLHVVQAQLGHSNVSVTSRYISHLAPQEVVKTMQARAWAV